jgi:DNA helicase HerA-like ATPase
MSIESGKNIGMVIGGSLSQGTDVKLNSSTSVEDIKSGQFLTIEGKDGKFFGVVTDVSLENTDSSVFSQMTVLENKEVVNALKGTVAYGKVSLSTNLILPTGIDSAKTIEPAKTIPAHFSNVQLASELDIQTVFGEESENNFWIGTPLDMDTRVCINLEEFVKRSVGVFGKSGTGKTFLTRLLLVGILQHNKASALIFDMHSEYGQTGQDTDRNMSVKGLKQLFPEKVTVFTLDEESSRRRNSKYDVDAKIGYHEIEPEDLELLKESLNLSDIAIAASYVLERHFGARQWLEQFINLQTNDEVYELADSIGVSPQALRALYERLNRFKRFGFLISDSNQDIAIQMIQHVERGNHVVVQFVV